MNAQCHERVFRPRAWLVSMLGEHLISDEVMALIGLIKNAYDADATRVTVEICDVACPARIPVTVLDNGYGMTVDDVRQKWLSPAVNHKERAKHASPRTPRGRLPIGEKGVGRFAVHQIGRILTWMPQAEQMALGLSHTPR